MLGRLVSEARAGRGGALIVAGEAGVGKTALLRAAEAEVAGTVRLLGCSGVQAEVALAFSGLHRLLTPLLTRLRELPDEHAGRCAVHWACPPTPPPIWWSARPCCRCWTGRRPTPRC